MKLLAYNISGNTVGIDLESWSDDKLNGNKPFLVSFDNTTYNGYDDISTIENWDKFGISYSPDYGTIKFAVKNIVDTISWSGLTDTEKDIVIKYYSYNSETEAVTHLMTKKGLSFYDSKIYILQAWHKHHLNFITSCEQRWAYAKFYVLLYLSRKDAEDLFETTKNLIDFFVQTGRLGVDYNDQNSGIIDFVYSQYDYVGQGLEESGYVLQQGTWQEFKDKLFDVFVNGNYLTY